jgi:RNA polymerase sigma factor (sigma-70 family)
MSVAAAASPTDVSDLYRAFSDRLERIVRLEVAASDAVVEDACQFAWDRLVCHRDRIRRETAARWLAKTAVREAVRLLRREQRFVSLDATATLADDSGVREAASGPEELILNRERLASVDRLPRRQQQMVWLHAVGLTYAEIAVHTGCTARTVERQLLRAKRAVRAG